ncbi:hypothetical protein HW561_17430 [Rhodobacteraceae bacterium B1Z28]|uniref:Lipocalin-like domain-containing protein n=1 Tax=Ruegeria haliotis TaxID=2747601 RepID=A0ABX2PTS5_9RHOB|nr:hypothetical protein [Ruegeria haliotis]
MNEEQEKVLGRWVHVPEEDKEGIQVFRPSDYPLPPSRGRAQLAFYPDHTVKAAGIGSNDIGRVTQGHWTGTTEQGGTLEVTFENLDARSRVELQDESGPVLKLIKSR